MRDINIRATEYFEAVARLGTVTKAAEELGISPSAVSQQIKNLETQFGVRLFRREKRRLVLTHDGDRLFRTITQAFGALRNARNAICGQSDRRSLSIHVSPSFGEMWLARRIADFAESNREWSVRIVARSDFTSFETEAVDCDIRYGLGDWAGLSTTNFMRDQVMPMCSPAYLHSLRSISPDPLVQLQHARLIDSAKTLCRWDIWLARNGVEIPDLAYPFRFDRSSMAIEIAKQGGGLILNSVPLCLPDLRRGRLVPFSTAFEVIELPAYWFVCPERHFNRRIVTRFSDWISRVACQDQHEVRAYLAGEGCRMREEDGPAAFEFFADVD